MGSTQGDRNEISPAIRAISRVVSEVIIEMVIGDFLHQGFVYFSQAALFSL
jgi:hypothetical protein